jgi:TRAP-type uncharacterized transport system substrate-binding protein
LVRITRSAEKRTSVDWFLADQFKHFDVGAQPAILNIPWPEAALMGARIPVHPGAMRYYKEMGYVK